MTTATFQGTVRVKRDGGMMGNELQKVSPVGWFPMPPIDGAAELCAPAQLMTADETEVNLTDLRWAFWVEGKYPFLDYEYVTRNN